MDEKISIHMLLNEKQMRQALWRLEIIRPALLFQNGSAERHREIARIAQQPVFKLSGKVGKVSVSLLYVWVKAYESGGIAALVPMLKGPKRG